MTEVTPLVGFIGGVGPMEMMIVGIIAVLLFGKRLPEVGRSLGRGLTEFKKGIRGIEDEINSAVSAPTRTYSSPSARYEERDEAVAPKFEPPPAPDEPQTA